MNPNVKAIWSKYWASIATCLQRTMGDDPPSIEDFTFEIYFKPAGFGEDEPLFDKMDQGQYTLCFTDCAGNRGQTIARWELVQMKNCCGICVSTAAYVEPEFRNKGLGLVLNQIRIDMARAMGYSLLFCTDVVANEPQQKILNANGWQRIHTFLNRGSGNVVGLHIIGL